MLKLTTECTYVNKNGSNSRILKITDLTLNPLQRFCSQKKAEIK